MRTINYKVSYEKMISRLPALFAYLEIDEQGSCEIVKATKGKQGDYGKIIANINVPSNCAFEYVSKDGILLKVNGGENAYRTIIDTYYKAISDKDWERVNGVYENKFLRFVERGIGLKFVGLTQETTTKKVCGVPQTAKYPLAPDYIYLGEAQTLLDKMIKLKKQVKFYEQHTKGCRDDRKYYEQAKNEYLLSNGDKLIEELYKLVKEAEEVATEYFNYTKNTNGLTLDFNVSLFNTIKDLGMVTPYIQEWEAGKRYYEGDVVYYVDDNGYGLTWECILERNDVKTDELGRKYTEGDYDEATEVITFDYNDTEAKHNWKPQTLNWVNRNKRYICPQCGRIFEENPNKCKCGYDMNNVNPTTYVTNMPSTITIQGTCNSHLSSLRRFETYTNRYDEAEYPDTYKDWLWYYRKNRIMNRESKYDEFGNIGVMYDEGNVVGKGVEAIINDNTTIGSNIKWENDYAINLAAWGDAITSIKATNDEDTGIGTLSFEYIIGAHLKANKGCTIKVNNSFTVNGVSYKKGDIIPYLVYKENNLSNKVTFKVNKGFSYGGEKISSGNITIDQYNLLKTDWYEFIKEYTINRKCYKVGTQLSKSMCSVLLGMLKDCIDSDRKIVTEFTIEGKYYAVDTLLSLEDYNALENTFMSCFNSAYNVIRPFSIGGKTYQVGDEISSVNFKELTEDIDKTLKNCCKLEDGVYVVYSNFTINDITYEVGSKLSKDEYNALSPKNYCICDKDKIVFTFQKELTKEAKIYTKDEEISRDVFDDFDVEYQNHCYIIVNKDFYLKVYENGSWFDGGGYEIVWYNVGDVIPFSYYTTLDEEYKNKMKFVVKDTFSVVSKYEVGDVIDRNEYESLPDSQKKVGANFIFTVVEDFVNGGTRYKKGDDLSQDIFNKIEQEKNNINNVDIYSKSNIVLNEKGKEAKVFEANEYINTETYNSLTDENKRKCTVTCDDVWYSVDDDGNYKYYFKDFEIDTDSKYSKNMGVKYTETYIYYKGNTDMEVKETFDRNHYAGDVITKEEYDKLSEDNKKKCRHVEDSIWTLVEDGTFEKYVNGEYDKGFLPSGIISDENYYKIYNKMEFDTSESRQIYKLKVGNRFKKVSFVKTNYEASVDITHVDIEERPLIRYDYYNGVSFQAAVNDDVNIERGVTQAFEKHFKLGEIKTFEDFENYANGGFFTFSNENIDLG